MRLVELIMQASGWTDEISTIYVTEPWSCEAEAILVSPAPDTTEAIERDGLCYRYFLETFIAREVMDRLGCASKERCERLIDYAQNDA